jgi:hypothetical protein
MVHALKKGQLHVIKILLRHTLSWNKHENFVVDYVSHNM